jgi:hypothetical protein
MLALEEAAFSRLTVLIKPIAPQWDLDYTPSKN